MAFVKLASQQNNPVQQVSSRVEDRRYTIGDLAKRSEERRVGKEC